MVARRPRPRGTRLDRACINDVSHDERASFTKRREGTAEPRASIEPTSTLSEKRTVGGVRVPPYPKPAPAPPLLWRSPAESHAYAGK